MLPSGPTLGPAITPCPAPGAGEAAPADPWKAAKRSNEMNASRCLATVSSTYEKNRTTGFAYRERSIRNVLPSISTEPPCASIACTATAAPAPGEGCHRALGCVRIQLQLRPLAFDLDPLLAEPGRGGARELERVDVP